MGGEGAQESGVPGGLECQLEPEPSPDRKRDLLKNWKQRMGRWSGELKGSSNGRSALNAEKQQQLLAVASESWLKPGEESPSCNQPPSSFLAALNCQKLVTE